VNDDDIEIYTDETPQRGAMTWRGLRQQTERPVIDGVPRPNRCLADFIAPKGVKHDHIGLFAVTAGLGVEKKEKQFLDDHDDYSRSCSRRWPTAWPRPSPSAAPARAHRPVGLRGRRAAEPAS
jgi:cobalamin-dependent methionine synthase I